MGLFSFLNPKNLIRGGVGFLTGGWPGAAAGMLSGGSSPQPAPAYGAQPAAAYGGQAVSPLNEYLQRQAFMRGIREGLGVGAPQTFQPLEQQAMGTTGGRQSQQAGGMSFPQSIANPRLSLLGRGGGEGGRGGNSQGQQGQGQGAGAADDDLLSIEDLRKAYMGYMQRSLAGTGGLPANIYQGAMTRGMGVIGAQAQQSREALGQRLGSRGLLRSGIYGQGLADIERGRLGEIGQLAGGLEQIGLTQAQAAQGQAAGLYAAEQQQLRQDILARALPGISAQATEPSTFDRIAQLAGMYGQYQYRPQTPDIEGIIRGIYGGLGLPAASTPSPAAGPWEDWRRGITAPGPSAQQNYFWQNL